MPMPVLSNSSAYIPASAIRVLTPYAERAEAEGIKVYHLNIGAPDIKSPVSAVKAVADFRFDHLPYSNSAGSLELRQALTKKYYNKVGLDVCPDDILVTTAGSEALSFIFHAVCDPGDEILAMEPFYCNYSTMSRMNGVDMKAVHTDIDSAFALPSAAEIERHITPRTRAIIVCNPSNPTGTLYGKAEMLAIGDICRRHDIFLICDEAYREFCYTEEPYFSAWHIPDLDQNVVLVDSASKRYNLCGARIGCIVSRNRELLELITRFAQARLCPPVLGQVATLGALEADASYFEAVRNEYIARRDFMIKALNDIPGVYSPVPEGAFYTVARLPVKNASDFCKWLLAEFRLNGETLMLTPAEPFYSTPGCGRNEVRIAYVLEIPQLKRAVKILEKALVSYKG